MNCLYCGKETFLDIGFVTDGKVSVCNICATKHSLFDFATNLENLKIDSPIKRMFSESIISNQSDLSDLIKEMENKSALNAEYGKAVIDNYQKKKPVMALPYGMKVADIENDDMEQREREDAFEITDDVKTRVDGLLYVCRVLWESTHDKKQVYIKYVCLAEELSKQYGVSISDLGLVEPAYVYSDGTIKEVPNVVLASGSAWSDEECELHDDIENMSEDDFLNKYVDNQEALLAWQDYHLQFDNTSDIPYLEV